MITTTKSSFYMFPDWNIANHGIIVSGRDCFNLYLWVVIYNCRNELRSGHKYRQTFSMASYTKFCIIVMSGHANMKYCMPYFLQHMLFACLPNRYSTIFYSSKIYTMRPSVVSWRCMHTLLHPWILPQLTLQSSP